MQLLFLMSYILNWVNITAQKHGGNLLRILNSLLIVLQHICLQSWTPNLLNAVEQKHVAREDFSRSWIMQQKQKQSFHDNQL